MNKVKEVLAVLGLEINREYKATAYTEAFPNGNQLSGVYMLSNWGAVACKAKNENKWLNSDFDIKDLIMGELVFSPVTFKPKDNEQFYLVLLDGTTRYSSFSINDTYDFYAVNTGNCFKTRDEAEANKDRILAMFEKMRNGEYGNE